MLDRVVKVECHEPILCRLTGPHGPFLKQGSDRFHLTRLTMGGAGSGAENNDRSARRVFQKIDQEPIDFEKDIHVR
jgi:hypothetical protein